MYAKRSFIHNSLKLETTQMSSNRTFVVPSYIGRLDSAFKRNELWNNMVCLKNSSGAKEIQAIHTL